LAATLAQGSSDLNFRRLTTLSDEAAEALGRHNGKLSCNALTTLSEEGAQALARHEDVVGKAALSPEVAKTLAASSTWNGFLPGVSTFDSPDSVAIAEALATRSGRLALPNLKKISPETLTALIQKEDVEIPLIETLELIPEPDGSVTEDFVMPHWLDERQKLQREARAARAAE
jgi:hypothetical protein